MKMRLFYQILAIILVVLFIPATCYNPLIGLTAACGILAFVLMSAYVKE